MSIITGLVLVGVVWSGLPGAMMPPDDPAGIEISVTIDRQEPPAEAAGLPATGGELAPIMVGGAIGALLVAGGAMLHRRGRGATPQ